jgi:protein phosphatase 1 regulatory subunit 11
MFENEDFVYIFFRYIFYFMARTVTTTTIETVNLPPTLVLELNNRNESSPRVRWTEETIDNEHMNKKKSKCCCIYTKPHDPQSTNDQTTEFDNCQHCRFHTESDYAAKPEERQSKIKLVVEKPPSS